MKNKLIYNYWMIIVAWSLFLNGHSVMGCLLGFVSSLYLLLKKKKLNYMRIVALTIIVYLMIEVSLTLSSIPYFFPNLFIFMTFISLNMAISNEYLYFYKKQFILSIIYIILVSVAVLSVLIKILPDELYTLFSKSNLYLMSSYIFLPYLIPCFVCLKYKVKINKKINIETHKQSEAII